MNFEIHPQQPQVSKVPLSKKVGWGMGGLADNFMFNSLGVLTMPIFNIGLGLDAFLVGLASGIPRLLDALTDTFVGNLSDNTSTRWGRRRPYIVAGTIGCAMLFPMIWMPPFHSQWGMFGYLLTIVLLYLSLAYSVFVIPYTALGYEQTSDYNEKTRLLAWRMYIGLLGALAVPWLYKLCLLDIFPNEVIGVRYVSLGICLIILVAGLAPIFVCEEHIRQQPQPRITFTKAIQETWNNKTFLRLMGVYTLLITGLFTGVGLSLYVNIYYICDGDKAYAAKLVATAGSIMALMSYISLPIATRASAKIGKHKTMLLGLLFSSMGAATYWITLRPDRPELQYISAAIIGCTLQGCWLMVSSMVADICDEDELITGLRREGFYSAVMSFCRKIALGFAQILTGGLLMLKGFDIELATDGILNTAVPIRIFHGFVILQVITPIAAVLMFRQFSLTIDRMVAIRAELDFRRKELAVD